jgi:TetR/AcrR family transcriptional regulator
MHATKPAHNQTDRADETRARILDAAMREFSANGLAGARTERIAQAAGVNKALLYYYFQGKEAIYTAALESVAARIAESSFSVLEMNCSPGERLLRIALNHFDRIYSQSIFQTLMQHEMMRLREGGSTQDSPLIAKLFKPMTQGTLALAEVGIGSGELIRVEKSQLVYAIFGPNVFYFLTAPMMAVLLVDNLLGAAALAFRRKAAVDFLGQALFVDREHGAATAARVLADSPMPESIELAEDPFKRNVRIRKRRNDTSIGRQSIRPVK